MHTDRPVSDRGPLARLLQAVLDRTVRENPLIAHAPRPHRTGV